MAQKQSKKYEKGWKLANRNHWCFFDWLLEEEGLGRFHTKLYLDEPTRTMSGSLFMRKLISRHQRGTTYSRRSSHATLILHPWWKLLARQLFMHETPSRMNSISSLTTIVNKLSAILILYSYGDVWQAPPRLYKFNEPQSGFFSFSLARY